MTLKCLGLYRMFIGTESAFCTPFKDDDTKYDLAQKFWMSLESHSLSFVLLFLAVALVASLYYYGPYNNQSGRHYKHSHWLGFFLGSLAIQFAATYFLVKYNCKTSLSEASPIYWKMGLGNVFWGGIIFMLVSLFYSWICPTKTNANPLL